MRKILITVAAALVSLAASASDTVLLLHFSDYHSHAVPFFTDRGPSQGGIARAIWYLEREKKNGALVFNGGDMMNKGAPSWSDKYGCAEWPWLNGIVDAMALGNHDVDYGLAALDACRKSVRYPILSANTAGFDAWRVFEVKGHRIGVFAIAGADFPKLVKAEGLSFSDPVEAARNAVAALKKESVDFIVMIGHEQTEDDYALAHEVEGIDLIFGTHAHLERGFARIPGSKTWFISPGQYLENIARVELTFEGKSLTRVNGSLLFVGPAVRESKTIARRVERMQRDLERDPKYRKQFEPVATLVKPLFTEQVAELTLRVMRRETGADVSLSTVSSFRGAIDQGPLTLEALTAALPYDNEIVVCTMTAQNAKGLIQHFANQAGDSRAYVDKGGLRLGAREYRVATTDYMARSFPSYFPCTTEKTGIRVREALTTELRKR